MANVTGKMQWPHWSNTYKLTDLSSATTTR